MNKDMHDVTITDAQPNRLFIADFTEWESLLMLEMLKNVYSFETIFDQMCSLMDINPIKHEYIFKRIINWLEKGEY